MIPTQRSIVTVVMFIMSFISMDRGVTWIGVLRSLICATTESLPQNDPFLEWAISQCNFTMREIGTNHIHISFQKMLAWDCISIFYDNFKSFKHEKSSKVGNNKLNVSIDDFIVLHTLYFYSINSTRYWLSFHYTW